MDSIIAPKIRKPKSRIKKLGRSDIQWSNSCEDQATHFIGCIESLNAKNSYCNYNKIETTSNLSPFTNFGNIQVWTILHVLLPN